MIRILLLVMFGLFLAPALVVAQEPASEAVAEVEATKAVAVAKAEIGTKKPAWVEDLQKSASREEQMHFYMVYTTHSLLGTLQMVRDDVERAVEECSMNNPDMEEKMTSRFKLWNEALAPVFSEVKAHVANMVLVQDYADKGDMNALMVDIDAQRVKSLKGVNKVPVSAPGACQHLYDKMDDTQDKMTTLLRQTLVSMPVSPAKPLVPSFEVPVAETEAE